MLPKPVSLLKLLLAIRFDSYGLKRNAALQVNFCGGRQYRGLEK